MSHFVRGPLLSAKADTSAVAYHILWLLHAALLGGSPSSKALGAHLSAEKEICPREIGGGSGTIMAKRAADARPSILRTRLVPSRPIRRQLFSETAEENKVEQADCPPS